MSRSHILPSKVKAYLQRLALEYARSGKSILSEILRNARVAVVQETDYENDYEGGIYGHDVRFYLPAETLQEVPLNKENELREQIRQDLNHCGTSVQGEYFRAVVLEIEDEDDPVFQSSSSLFGQLAPDPERLTIWKPGYVRLFLSHKDAHKAAARALADALEEYGISAFVAHDNIEPMTTWQGEIEKALATMEVMLAFVTDNFHEGPWTNQEVGYAISKQTPIVSLKLQSADPAGFIGKIQAVRGRLEDPRGSASAVFAVIGDKLGHRSRLQRALISAFVASPDFSEAIQRFKRMDSAVQRLTEEEFASIAEGFASNDQLHNCGYLVNQRLQKFLIRTTGKLVYISGLRISLTPPPPDDDLPF